jgi:hypothetical protein
LASIADIGADIRERPKSANRRHRSIISSMCAVTVGAVDLGQSLLAGVQIGIG